MLRFIHIYMKYHIGSSCNDVHLAMESANLKKNNFDNLLNQ